MGRAEDIFNRVVELGEPALDEFILNRKSEELFLDFKRSADAGSGQRLDQNDRNNLAKAISGFGNSEGGVIVWGIDCSEDQDFADVAWAKVPIQNPARFISWLENAVSGCTIPPHGTVRNHSINIEGINEGFAITLIPSSLHAPHQAVGRLQYFMRAGSSFVPVPHAVLAGMFGRRPQPNVFNMYTIAPAKLTSQSIKIDMGFLVANKGPGIASDLFMNVTVFSTPGDNCELAFDQANLDLNHWIGRFAYGRILSIISKPILRLAPESQIQPFTMTLILAPPFTDDLSIEGNCGCSQSPTAKFKIQNDRASVERVYNSYQERNRRSPLSKAERHALVKEILQTDVAIS